MINPEHHAIVLQRLGKTIELAKTLKEEQFDYRNMITKYNVFSDCGTVCCIVGHYPNWGIEGFFYSNGSLMSNSCDSMEHFEIGCIHMDLVFYHFLAIGVIEYLFFGYGNPIDWNLDHEIDSVNLDLSLPEVIARFEEIYELVLTDKLDNSLYYVP